MSDFLGKLKSGAGKMAFEAEKMARLTKAKSELDRITDQIKAQYAKIGELYYTRRATTGVTGPDFDAVCKTIVDLEQQAKVKNEEVQKINAESFETQSVNAQPAPAQSTPPTPPPQATPVVKFCPNCGKQVETSVKFCPDCGQAL